MRAWLDELGLPGAARDPAGRGPGRGPGRLPPDGRPGRTDLADALGLVLAEAVTAAEPVPPFANTAMDGYAVRAADVAGASDDAPSGCTVIGTLAAGRAPDTAVGPGEAAPHHDGRPFSRTGRRRGHRRDRPAATGDTVVGRRPRPGAGDHVRPAGEDIAAGQEVFAAGTVLGPGHLGVLASVGGEKVAAVPGARRRGAVHR